MKESVEIRNDVLNLCTCFGSDDYWLVFGNLTMICSLWLKRVNKSIESESEAEWIECIKWQKEDNVENVQMKQGVNENEWEKYARENMKQTCNDK